MKLNEILFKRKLISENKLTIQPSGGYNVMTQETATFSTFSTLATSDIVRSAIRPKTKAVGKLMALHVKNELTEAHSNIAILLQEPNQLDSLQTLLEKLVTQLQLNNNAYAVVDKDKNGTPLSINPIIPTSTRIKESEGGNIFIEFTLSKGGQVTYPYEDVIHLRQEHNSKEYFGEHPSQFLAELIQSVTVSDEAVEKAVRNSTSLKWLMKFNSVIKEEDMKQRTEQFKKDFLSIQNEGGVGATDNKAELQQIKSDVYVPDTSIQKEKIKRIYDYFGVNEDIIQSKFNEETWGAYYESEIEPILLQLSNEFTRKLFLKSERIAGNKVIFTSSGLQFATLESKIKLTDLVDRGMMTPNESRKILNLPKIDGGDTPIRRLDTARVDDERFGKVEELTSDETLKGGEEDE